MNKIEDVILLQIEHVSKIFKKYSQKEFDKIGLNITVDQWVILKIISEHPNLTQKEIATKSYRDPASITRTLDLLEKKGYLWRESVDGNRRVYSISLTVEGHNLIANNMKMIKKQRINSVKGISVSELNTFSSLLRKMKKNME